ncbi:exodeoxyribonuclease V subunit alpha [Desulfoluna spongiiphila]|uniref:DNA helicase/exodeoxyribonuclease V, alpha subunit n=1 Tax=Desulfoluna spongiiphila TaxID=419481 RepID=A0A1G5IFK1_9BACT|nr:exodeoxyribonuclease V subunit alpha [Desulfoluna spongiiphila]SCY74531.1 DNA helicase/exodeoxyribonuclease V, alpha subunit [Desulfoluna spongiiphila]
MNLKQETMERSGWNAWTEQGFSLTDLTFASFLAQRHGQDASVFLAAALVSRESRHGHVCIDLSRYTGYAVSGESWGKDGASWGNHLRETGAAGGEGEETLLVLDGRGRLYLRRYHRFQEAVARYMGRETTLSDLPEGETTALKEGLDRYFPGPSGGEPDRQKLAAAVALVNRFCVISGGPGTGKTTTVTKILALLVEQHRRRFNGAPVIALAAPTGKAAARLMESMAGAMGKLDLSEVVKAALPREATTIHRLLGSLGRGRWELFRQGQALPCDILVVDEASMVDLPLMGRLVRSLAPSTRLILMGDRDQLASVEAGSVMGDLCHGKQGDTVSDAQGKLLAELTGISLPTGRNLAPLADAVTTLTKSYRFGACPGIGQAAAAANRGDARALAGIIAPGFLLAGPSVGEHPMAWLEEVVRHHLAGYRRLSDAREMLAALDRFRILCAVRKGPMGVARINRLVERCLGLGGGDLWYPGRPVMVTENDYTLGLFNGDTGITVRKDGELAVAFPDEEGGMRHIHSARLPKVETVFAMTVHKSQGSEFTHVILLLPESDAPVLTRELVYTGITRAREEMAVWSPPEILEKALGRRTQRASGLREMLWKGRAK